MQNSEGESEWRVQAVNAKGEGECKRLMQKANAKGECKRKTNKKAKKVNGEHFQFRFLALCFRLSAAHKPSPPTNTRNKRQTIP